MTQVPDTRFIVASQNEAVPATEVYVTPTGGSQTTLADALAGGSLTVTDGAHTVADVTSLSVTGGTVGGTSPNATLTISGGGGGAVIELESGSSGEKISEMSALTVPPGAVGAAVPVVVPGSTTNYKSPIATLLTGAAGEAIAVAAGDTGDATDGGALTLYAGYSEAGNGGYTEIKGGSVGSGAGFGGDVYLLAGRGQAGDGGGAYINGGVSGTGAGGSVQISGGNAQSGSGNGGDIILHPGSSDGGTNGRIYMIYVPVGDPHVSNVVYQDGSGFLKISAG